MLRHLVDLETDHIECFLPLDLFLVKQGFTVVTQLVHAVSEQEIVCPFAGMGDLAQGIGGFAKAMLKSLDALTIVHRAHESTP